MPSGPDNKWIRSLKDNEAGRVVADPEGNRWQWDSDEATSHLLKKLHNEELAIEQTDIHPTPPAKAKPQDTPAREAKSPTAASPSLRPAKPGGRDAGGGFNPYDNSGRPKRR
jgi:hypothetical protein